MTRQANQRVVRGVPKAISAIGINHTSAPRRGRREEGRGGRGEEGGASCASNSKNITKASRNSDHVEAHRARPTAKAANLSRAPSTRYREEPQAALRAPA